MDKETLGFYASNAEVYAAREITGHDRLSRFLALLPSGVIRKNTGREEPRCVASRLRREAWGREKGRSAFNRPLHYQSFDVA